MGLSRRFAARAGTAAAILALAAGANPGALAQAGEERAVAQAVEALNKAMLDVDRAQLEALTAPQLSYGHSAGRIENQKQFVDYLVSRESAFRRIEAAEQTIALVGNEAIVRHMLIGETVNPAGQVSPVRVGVMQVWQKQGGDWKLLARQAYRL